jgi:protein gp37
MSSKGKTGITWADRTWNPIVGCAPIATECRHCYAARDAHRMAGHPNPKVCDAYRGLVDGSSWTGEYRFLEERLVYPLRWSAPSIVFVCSMSDLFYEPVADEEIARVWDVMRMATRHTFLVLTKRIERGVAWYNAHPLANVWVGTTAGTPESLERVDVLRTCTAPVRFLSVEPFIAPFHDAQALVRDLSWLIVGGESGIGARPMHPDWARAIRDACVAESIPFHYKQHGVWVHDSQLHGSTLPSGTPTLVWPDGSRSYDLGRAAKAVGHALDGVVWEEFPAAPTPATMTTLL